MELWDIRAVSLIGQKHALNYLLSCNHQVKTVRRKKLQSGVFFGNKTFLLRFTSTTELRVISRV